MRLTTHDRTPSPPRCGLLAAALLILLPNLVIFLVRVTATLSHGQWFEATGTERVPIYGVWKALHGYPIYEQPFSGDFALSMYNYGFYSLYGAVASAMGWDGERLVIGSRLLTATWSLVCAMALIAVLRAALGSTFRACAGTAAALCAATMLSSTAVGWWGITVRPDMASLACATVGLAAWIVALDRRQPMAALLASALFIAAWIVKQSTIAMFVGCVLAGAVLARPLLTALLALPFAIVTAGILYAGSPEYRLNLLTAPAISRFDAFDTQWQYVALVILPSPHLLALPAAGLLAIALRRWNPLRDAGSVAWTVLGLVSLSSIAWCALGVIRAGGDRNTLLEAYLALSLLAWALMLGRPALVFHGRWLDRSVAAAVLATSLFPWLQLAFFDRLGDLNYGTAGEVLSARRVASWIAASEKPVFVEQRMLALPWYSTGGRYPAVVLDDYYFNMPVTRTMVEEAGGLESLVTTRRFPVLLLTGQFRLTEAALQAGYVRTGAVGEGVFRYDVYEFRRPDAAMRQLPPASAGR